MKIGSSLICLFFIFLLSSCHKEETKVPVTPTLGTFKQLAPENGSPQVSVLPEFSWETSTNTLSYELTVSVNSNYTNPVIDVKGLTSASYTSTTPLLPFEKYYWKVMALSAKDSTLADNAGIYFTTSATVTANYYVSPTGTDAPGNGGTNNPCADNRDDLPWCWNFY
jgi:hypothetical protein